MALHLTAYSLRFAVLRSGFRRQVSFGVRRRPKEEPMLFPAMVVAAILAATMPVLDGRSEETLQASAEKVKASLPEALWP
jgi:hypothetical protein